MISCSKCKKATLPPTEGGCIKTGGIVDIGCEYGEPRILTHYDEIQAMNVEELASWLCDIAGWLPEYEGRMHTILEWLKQEAVSDSN